MYKYGVSPIFSLPFALNGGAVDREQACRTMTTATPCYEYGTAVRRICHPPRSVYQHYMLILNKLDKSPQNSLICALGTFILKRRPSRGRFFFAFLYKPEQKKSCPTAIRRQLPLVGNQWYLLSRPTPCVAASVWHQPRLSRSAPCGSWRVDVGVATNNDIDLHHIVGGEHVNSSS